MPDPAADEAAEVAGWLDAGALADVLAEGAALDPLLEVGDADDAPADEAAVVALGEEVAATVFDDDAPQAVAEPSTTASSAKDATWGRRMSNVRISISKIGTSEI